MLFVIVGMQNELAFEAKLIVTTLAQFALEQHLFY